MTLGEKIRELEKTDPEMVVALKGKYGMFWIGKVKFVFGAVTFEAWNSTDTEVIRDREIL